MPSGFTHHRWHRIADCIYLVTLPTAEVAQLTAHPDVLLLETGSPLTTSGTASDHAPKAAVAPAAVATGTARNGAGVMVGIIDHGLDFVLDDFRDANGRTRVAYLWDQSMKPVGDEHAPVEFGFGVEYDSTAIDRALASPDPFSVVRHKPQAKSHGTHVTGIAVGNGRSFDRQ